jgi:hypothetical protein
MLKKTTNIFLQEDLSEEERIGLSNLITMIKRINTNYSVDDPLSPKNMKGKLKINILREIQKRNDEINKKNACDKHHIYIYILTLSLHLSANCHLDLNRTAEMVRSRKAKMNI